MPFSPSRTSAEALAACSGLRSLTAALRHAVFAAQAISPVVKESHTCSALAEEYGRSPMPKSNEYCNGSVIERHCFKLPEKTGFHLGRSIESSTPVDATRDPRRSPTESFVEFSIGGAIAQRLCRL